MKKKNPNVLWENRGKSLFLFGSIITLVLMLTFSSVFAQQVKTVNGIVKDESGVTLPGVTVVVEGTTQGTVTDMDGNFQFEIPIDAQALQFSFVGLKTQTVSIGSKVTFEITMITEAIGLEEVVAVGYGTQKKATLTGSVETVSEEVFVDRAVSRVGRGHCCPFPP